MLSFLKTIWQKNWQNKATIIAGVLILLLAASAVVYAVITREGDVGFIEIGDGKKLHWEKSNLPILCTHDDTVDYDQLEYFNKTRTEINKKTGKLIFSPCIRWMLQQRMPGFIQGSIVLRMVSAEDWDAQTSQSDSEVAVDTPWESHPGGQTQLKYNKSTGEIIGASVLIDSSIKKELLYRVWLHELGHVVGLSHDRRQDSIMYKSATGRSKTLSTTDVRSLREAYAR